MLLTCRLGVVMALVLGAFVHVFFVQGTAAAGPPTIGIESSIDGGPWTKSPAIYPVKGQSVRLKIAEQPGATARWYQVVPDISEVYQNCNFPWEPNPYKWIGLAKIKYLRKELEGCRGRWEVDLIRNGDPQRKGNKAAETVSAMVKAPVDSPHYREDAGSFWFQVEVHKKGRVTRSPGVEDSDNKGLSPKVFRVSVRDGRGYLGYVTSFFNVPGLFGSIPHQSNNYIGADCADVLASAYGKWRGKTIQKNYSVAMLVTRLRKRAEAELTDGKPNKTLEWGKQIHPGDFIAVGSSKKGPYVHIGALFSDADKNGVLSAGDLVLHAGPMPLHFTPLREGKFDGNVVILDPHSADLAESQIPVKPVARETRK
ncbi:MAG: hypothetical protein AB1646_24040 [Thermodesulfobacteriota bacterium]